LRALDCVFRNHTRGALRATGNARLWLQRCLFQANALSVPMPLPGSLDEPPPLIAQMGSAIAIQGTVRARVLACGFWDNGGPTCLAGGAVVVNTSHTVPVPAHVIFSQCVLGNNSAADAGGALCVLAGGCVNVSDTTFLNNTAWGVVRGGGGLYAEARQVCWVWNCSFAWNRCPETGGAIAVKGERDTPDDVGPAPATPACGPPHAAALTAARRAAQPEDDNEEEEGMMRTKAHVPVGRVVDFRKCFFKQNWPAWSAPALSPRSRERQIRLMANSLVIPSMKTLLT